MKIGTIYILVATAMSYAGDTGLGSCKGTWIAWKREPYEYFIVNGKEEKAPKSDTVQHHLIVIQSSESCEASLNELPAFVDELKKDTSYSASDGGFKTGVGKLSVKDSLLEISGKYKKAYYSRISGDSTFVIKLKPNGHTFLETKTGLKFILVSDSARKELKGRWGIEEVTRHPIRQ